MHASQLLLLALPSALAVHLYSVPQSLSLAEADETNDCVLPDSYYVSDFQSTSGTGGTNLTAFSFGFKDKKTGISSPCEFNSSSVSTLSGSSSRYPCDDTNVDFIWQDEPNWLTMIEYVCSEDGAPKWEVAGTLKIYLNCPESGGSCSTNLTTSKALFTSLNPARVDPSKF